MEKTPVGDAAGGGAGARDSDGHFARLRAGLEGQAMVAEIDGAAGRRIDISAADLCSFQTFDADLAAGDERQAGVAGQESEVRQDDVTVLGPADDGLVAFDAARADDVRPVAASGDVADGQGHRGLMRRRTRRRCGRPWRR